MMVKKYITLIILFFSFCNFAESQSVINSPLQSTSILKVGVNKNGVFQLKGSQLAALGWTLPFPSQEIICFGPNNYFPQLVNAATLMFPYQEISLKVKDGGDGLIHSEDQIFWYAHAKNGWLWNSNETHFFNNSTDTIQYYYFQKSQRTKNISQENFITNSPLDIKSVYTSQRIEKDSFNLLSSGRDWWTSFFSRLGTDPITVNYTLPTSLVENEPLYVRTRTASRSFGAENIFHFKYGLQTHQFSALGIGNGNDLFAQVNEEKISFQTNIGNNKLQLTVESAGINAQAWIDFIEWETPVSPQSLKLNEQFLVNRKKVPGNYQLKLPQSNVEWRLWNISNISYPKEYKIENKTVEFTAQQTSIFYLFSETLASSPYSIEKVVSRNLYENLNAQYLIITSKLFIEEAERIAAFHQKNNINTKLVDVEDIYFHFGNHESGIRNFIAYQYHLSPNDLKYILLIGAGSFDPLNRMGFQKNIIPTFQTKNSVDPFASFTTDDYFVSLQTNADFDNGNNLSLQLAIGRLPVRNNVDLKNYIDKFYEYHHVNSRGEWKQKLAFVADDGDGYLHFEDAESVVKSLPLSLPYVKYKIYLDAYKSIHQNGVKTYPIAVNENINLLNNGVAIWNFNGHGSFSKLADENLLDLSIVQKLNNRYRLPLIISSTCNFAPFDQVQYSSIGEKLLFQSHTGAIAVLSTSRMVYASSNRKMNEAYMEALFDASIPITERTIGRSLMRAKNKLYAEGDINNNAKFLLLGDPALQVLVDTKTDLVDSVLFKNKAVDTLYSTNEYTLRGNGKNISTGNAHVLILNDPIVQYTFGENPKSFLQETGIVYKGKSVINDSKFYVKFIVPTDLRNEIKKSNILYYINDATQEYIGSDRSKWIGGMGEGEADRMGPEIKLYLNDEKFVSGSMTNADPIFIAKISDSSGINLLGSGLGHDILLNINDDAGRVYSLNKYFESDQDGNKSGMIRFIIPSLEVGMHYLKLRVWDVFNQMSEKQLDFQVVEKGEFHIKNVLNYPNPFTNNTKFWFEHNRPGEELIVTISIFTVTGKLVKTLRETIITVGTRSDEMGWNARDEFGNKLGRGVYIYKISIKNRERQEFMKFEKLFIL